MKDWKIQVQVQAQFNVVAETFEDACDIAVDLAMDMESPELGTVLLEDEATNEA